MADAPGNRALPVVSTDTARIVGGIGVLACVLCCVSIPSFVAAISALGLGFLRNDRLLFPAEIVSVIVLVGTFLFSRRRHGRNGPVACGLAAAGWMFFGLKTPQPLGTVAALSGGVLLVLVVVWDWRVQRACRL